MADWWKKLFSGSPVARRVVAWAVAVLLGVGVGLLYNHRRLVAKHRARLARVSAPFASAAAARRYAQPLLSPKDLPIEHDLEVSEDDADTALSDFKPRDDRPAWPLKLPIDWNANPFKDRNWEYKLNALGMTNPLLVRYGTHGDSSLYHQAVAFALDWWAFHRDGKGGHYAWYDMATGVRASIVAFLLDRAFSGREKLEPQDEAALIEMAHAHVVELTNPANIVPTNHGLFQLDGLDTLCRVLGGAGPCKGVDPFVAEQVTRLLDTQFDAHGVHREQSPQYHQLAIEMLTPFARPSQGGVFKTVAERLDKARAVFPWFVFPGGRLAALGDSVGEARVAPPPDQRCTGGAAPDCVELGDFSRSGYVVVRSPWSRELKQSFMLIMTGTYNQRTHKHVDDLSFELMERGELLFEDAGKYAYLHDKMSTFVHSARAHNTVGLQDQTIKLRDTYSYGSALQPPEQAEGVTVLRGEVSRHALFTQARRIDYAPGRYLLITDALKSSVKRRYESYLHLAEHLQPHADGKAFVAPLADGRSMRIEALSHDCSARQERGIKDPTIQGWVTKSYREMAPASALTFTCSGKRRSISLLVSFDAAARADAIARFSKRVD